MAQSTFEGPKCALIMSFLRHRSSRDLDDGILCFLSLGFAPRAVGGEGHFSTHHQVSQKEAFHVTQAHNVLLLS